MKPSRSLRRRIRRGRARLTTAERPGSDAVRIDDLISPLRYDVLVRRQLFELLSELPAAERGDLQPLVELSRETPYFTWFRRIVVPRFKPELVGREKAIARAYEDRVRRSVELYEGFTKSGYRAESPITLLSGRAILATETGKRLDRGLYAGDGCHRLALLRSSGVTVLEPGTYRIQVERRLTPLDHTARLIGLLGIEPAQYFEFLSLSYAPDNPCRTGEQLLDRVRSDDPGRLSEIEGVLAVDLPLLSGL